MPTEFSQAVYTEAEHYLSNESEDINSDCLVSQLESILTTLEEVIQLLNSCDDYATRFSIELQLLNVMRHKGGRMLRHIVYGCDDCTIPAVGVKSLPIRCGQPGRPLIAINIELVQFLRSAGYKCDEVASVVGVSRSTLWRRLRALGVDMDTFTDISDSNLDDVVTRIQQQHPNVG